jgi:hypothetical protein
MKHSPDLEKEARETRNLAKRARRLSRELSEEADRERLIRFADELDQRVAKLEPEAAAQRPATPTGSVVTHEQHQVRQQGAEPTRVPREPKTEA